MSSSSTTGSSWLRACADKLHHDIFDVRYRAIQALSSKLRDGLISVSQIIPFVSTLAVLSQNLEHHEGQLISETISLHAHYANTLFLLQELSAAGLHIDAVTASRLRAFASKKGGISGVSPKLAADAMILAVSCTAGPPSTGISRSLDSSLGGGDLHNQLRQQEGTTSELEANSQRVVDVATRFAINMEQNQAQMRAANESFHHKTLILDNLPTTGERIHSDNTNSCSIGTAAVNHADPSDLHHQFYLASSLEADLTRANEPTFGSSSSSSSSSSSISPYVFPWICLTRADEQRLVDLIMLFKAAESLEDASLTNTSFLATGGFTEELVAVSPHVNPRAAPFVICTELFIADFPPEVFLSCPQLLSHLVAGLGTGCGNETGSTEATMTRNRQVQGSANTSSRSSVFDAAVSTLSALFDSLGDALALRANSDYLQTDGDSSAHSSSTNKDDEAARMAAVVLAKCESRSAVQEYAMGFASSTDGNSNSYGETTRATAAGFSLRRFRRRQGMSLRGNNMIGSTSAHTADSRYGITATVDGTSRGRTSSSFYVSSQVHDSSSPKGSFRTGEVIEAQPANVERYYGLRFRYPPPKLSSSMPSSSGSEFRDVSASLRGVSSSSPQSQSLIDTPVPLARFAGVVAEAAFLTCRYKQNIARLMPLLRIVLGFMFDPLLTGSPPADNENNDIGEEQANPKSSVDAALTQRVLDAAAEALTASLPISSSRNETASHSPVVTLAHFLDSTRSNTCILLVEAVATLVAHMPMSIMSIPEVQQQQSEGAKGIHGDDDDNDADEAYSATYQVGGKGAIDHQSSQHNSIDGTTFTRSTLTKAAKRKIRRAAFARACGRVVVPAAVMITVAAGLACGHLSKSSSTASFEQVRESLINLRIARLMPHIADAMISGNSAARDVSALPAAIEAARDAATAAFPFHEPATGAYMAATNTVSSGGVRNLDAPPGGRAFTAFVYHYSTHTASWHDGDPHPDEISRPIESFERYPLSPMNHLFLKTFPQRISTVLLYEIPTDVLSRTVALIAGGAASPPHPYLPSLVDGSTQIAHLLLRALLLHPHPHVRASAYASCTALVMKARQGDPHISLVQLCGNGATDVTATLKADLSSNGVLCVAAATGSVDAERGVRQAALSFLAEVSLAFAESSDIFAENSQSITTLLQIRRILLDAAEAEISSSSEAGVQDYSNTIVQFYELQLKHLGHVKGDDVGETSSGKLVLGEKIEDGDTHHVCNEPVFDLVTELFDPRSETRMLASAALVRKVTATKQSALVNKSMSLAPDVEGPALSSLFGRTQNTAAYVVQSEWADVLPGLLADPVCALAEITLSMAAHTTQSTSPTFSSSSTMANGSSSFSCMDTIYFDPSPSVLESNVQRALQCSRNTRFEASVSFAGSQLPQLEAVLASQKMPLSVRISTALQLAHTLMNSSPVPAAVQCRIAQTLDVAMSCIREYSTAGGLDASMPTLGLSMYEDGRRFVASLALLVDSLTATSIDARRAVCMDASYQILLVEVLYLGPSVASLSGATGVVMGAMDARVLALRALARCAFEADGAGIAPQSSKILDGFDLLSMRSSGKSTFFDDVSSGHTSLKRRTLQSSVTSINSASPPEVNVDAVSWNARPLLRLPFIAGAVNGATSRLVPVLRIDSEIHSSNLQSIPTQLSSYIVRKYTETENNQRFISSSLNYEEEESTQNSDFNGSISCLISPSSHAEWISAVQRACAFVQNINSNSTSEFVRILRYRLASSSSQSNSKPELSSTSQPRPRTVVCVAGEILDKFLCTPPSTEADRLSFASAINLLLHLLPYLDDDFTSSARNATSSLSMSLFVTFLQNPLVLKNLELTEEERSAGDAVVTAHLRHADDSVGQIGERISVAGDAGIEAFGRANLLVDTLRHSEYADVADGYLIDPHQPMRDSKNNSNYDTGQEPSYVHKQASVASDAATLLAGVHGLPHSIFDVTPFSPGRTMQLRAILALIAECCAFGSSPQIQERCALSLLTQTGGGAISSPRSQSPLVINMLLDLLNHPHSRSSIRLASGRALAALLQHGAVLDFLVCLPSSELPEAVEPAWPMPLCEVVASLIRIAGGGSHHLSFDSFQHKSLMRVTAASLSWIAQYAGGLCTRAPAYAETLLSPVVWRDKSSNTFSWLSRLTVDREASLRVCAFSCMRALLEVPPGFRAIANDSTMGDMLASCARHATGTVIADVLQQPGFLGRTVSHAQSVIDSWDAEVPAVRAACADVLAAYVRSSRGIAGMGLAGRQVSSSIGESTNPLIRLDLLARLKICFRSLVSGVDIDSESTAGDRESNFDAMIVSGRIVQLAGLCRLLCSLATTSPEAESSASVLFSVMSDSKARENLISMCGLTMIDATGGGLLSSPSSMHRQARILWSMFGQVCARCAPNPLHSSPLSWSASVAAFHVRSQTAAAVLLARASALRVLRNYLSSESATGMPLRLRRYHIQQALPHAVDVIVRTWPPELSDLAEGAQVEACLLLSAALHAWTSCCEATPSLTAAHPLLELVSKSNSSTQNDDTSCISNTISSGLEQHQPRGGSPGRSGKILDPLSIQSSVKQELSHIVSKFAIMITDSNCPLALRVAAAQTAGSLAVSLSRVNFEAQLSSSSGDRDPFKFVSETTSLVGGISALLLKLTAHDTKSEEQEVTQDIEQQLHRGYDGRNASLRNNSRVAVVEETDDEEEGRNENLAGETILENIGTSCAVQSGELIEAEAEVDGSMDSAAFELSRFGYRATAPGNNFGPAPLHNNPSTSFIRGNQSLPLQQVGARSTISSLSSVVSCGMETIDSRAGTDIVGAGGGTTRWITPSSTMKVNNNAISTKQTTTKQLKSSSIKLPTVREKGTGLSRAKNNPHASYVPPIPAFVSSKASESEVRNSTVAPAFASAKTTSVNDIISDVPVMLTTYSAEAIRLRENGATNDLSTLLGIAEYSGDAVVDLQRHVRDALQNGSGKNFLSSTSANDNNAHSDSAKNKFSTISAYTSTLSSASAVKAVLSTALVSILECTYGISIAAASTSVPKARDIGTVAADALISEKSGPAPLFRLLSRILECCAQCSMAEAGLATQAVQPVQALLAINSAVSDAICLLRPLAAAVLPSNPGRSEKFLATARDLQVGPTLARCLIAFGAVARSASAIGQACANSGGSSAADAIRSAALRGFSSAIDVAINFVGCGEACASTLASHAPGTSGYAYVTNKFQRTIYSGAITASKNGSFIDLVIGEALLASDAVIGSSSSASTLSPSSTTTRSPASTAGLFAGILTSNTRADLNVKREAATANLSTTAHTASLVVQLHNDLFMCLMGAAHSSAVCRQLILSRGVAGVITECCFRRLSTLPSLSPSVRNNSTHSHISTAPAYYIHCSVASLRSVPLSAMAAEMRTLAALCARDDSEANGATMRTPRITDLMVHVLRMKLVSPAAPFSTFTDCSTTLNYDNSVTRTSIERHLSDLRVAAATFLANASTRKGNEDVWLSRSPLIDASLHACTDDTLGVRAGAADMIWHLVHNTVRMRSALRTQGCSILLTKAKSQSDALLFRLGAVTQQRGSGQNLPLGCSTYKSTPWDNEAILTGAIHDFEPHAGEESLRDGGDIQSDPSEHEKKSSTSTLLESRSMLLRAHDALVDAMRILDISPGNINVSKIVPSVTAPAPKEGNHGTTNEIKVSKSGGMMFTA